ncbi:WAT1-related At5g47470-like isoform X1 [Olea europaea subsp. europaea]|uniref:WAT1-related protein n=1 Tax=Olea europaea subsp. europaea TaxID=158383 RepID=A0A8S0U2N1_OLEEU|nr:WAT1-related At5g47470-like isoform X1 [Olea europaea subsp. europaea]
MNRQRIVKGERGNFHLSTGNMIRKPKAEFIENVAIITGLTLIQFLYSGNSILLSYLLKLGFQPSSLIIFSTFATFLLLSPISILFERSQWPKHISYKVWIKLLLLSFGGVTVFQSLFMRGVSLTSPAMATAMPNLAPGLIFFIAWGFRLEKVELGCRYSRAKIMGTLLCVIGAVVMSLMQSSAQVHSAKDSQASLPSPPSDVTFDNQMIVGCLYLMAAVFVLSSQVVLQATTLHDFPAPISLCAITSLIGVVMTGLIKLIEDDELKTGWPLLSIKQLIPYSILAGSVSGLCVSFNAWAIKRRGPVMVSIFNPLGTVITVILSYITLGDSIRAESLAGMCLMFCGLYLVLWAKGKEHFHIGDDNSMESEYDVEKPLLS